MDSTNRYACVVDAQGRYVDFVLLLPAWQEDGTERWEVQYYTLKDGERLVDSAPPPAVRPHAGAEGLVFPRWEDEAWAESGTAAELAAWEAEHPAPEAPGPTAEEDRDAMLVDLEYRTTLLELGVNGYAVQNAEAHA